jgi:uncharacterized protein (TIGR00725 family)
MQVGIIGGGLVDEKTYRMAEEVGRLLATKGATIVGGGLSGVMEASAKGAKSEGGVTIGIIPGSDRGSSNRYTDYVIATDMGHARNIIIAHSSDALIAIGGEYGTLSEIAIALKLGKKVVSLASWDIRGVITAGSPGEAVSVIFEG